MPFVDDGKQDAKFAAFRSAVVAAAGRGDYPTVRRSISVQVRIADDEAGILRLERHWTIDKGSDRFLKELAAVLRLGGRFDDDRRTFTAPYVWTDFPDPEESPRYIVVIHPGTPLRDARGKIIATLSDEVGTHEVTQSPDWFKGHFLDGRTGFVERRHVRKPNDYRATFKMINGRWQLTVFEVGVD